MMVLFLEHHLLGASVPEGLSKCPSSQVDLGLGMDMGMRPRAGLSIIIDCRVPRPESRVESSSWGQSVSEALSGA